MALQDINIGTEANSGTGDSARIWAAKTNANFEYIAGLIAAITPVVIGDYTVTKALGKTDLENFEIGDKFTAWLENDTRYVVGKVIALPFDVDDDEKVSLVVDN